MKTISVADYLESTSKKYPKKIAFTDCDNALDFDHLRKAVAHVAMSILKTGKTNEPIAVFLDKSVQCVAAYVGVIYSGNFYSPLDTEMPVVRVEKILQTLQPKIIVTDKKHLAQVMEFSVNAEIIVYEETFSINIDNEKIKHSIQNIIDSNPMYVLFTSGSTGVPKGVVVSHRAFIDFAEWAADRYNFDDTVVFGNQVPFSFSMCIWDIYETIRCGGTCHILPQNLFMFPGQLMDFVAQKQINTLVWVPSALTIVVNLKGLKNHHVDSLKHVLFGGEVMPVKKLNKWIKEYPDVKFTNIYGPTEVTDTFMAYTINREFEDNESLPLGEIRYNHEIVLLDENDQALGKDDTGELCVRGAGLATGYYKNAEQTEKAFVQNPLNSNYKDIVYRTGDLVRYNKNGELIYVARKDFQIKHMGHRIELGEIETALTSIDHIDEGCCLYDFEKSRIVAIYTGNVSEEDLAGSLKNILPEYMLPNVRKKIDHMPHNLNGKIDRNELKKQLGN